MRSQISRFSSVFVVGFLLGRVEASCYYPDGTFPEDYVYVPCSGDEFTSCCIPSEGDQCLSNGLCYYPDEYDPYMFRGACTDQSWQSENCFQQCRGGEYQDGTYDKLVHCDGDRYCCDADGSTCCNDDSKVFTVAAASVIKDLATTSRPFPIQTIIGTSTDTGTYTTSSSLPADVESQKGTTVDSTATDTDPTSTSSSEAAKSKDEDSSSPSKTVLIGGGVGAAVVLILAVALVFFLMRRRYRKKLAAGSAMNAQSFPLSSTDGFQKLPEQRPERPEMPEQRPEQLPDKSPRPIEVPAPLHSPAPPYHPPMYQNQNQNPSVGLAMPGNAVEMESSYLPPGRNQWGQPVYEAPALPYRRI